MAMVRMTSKDGKPYEVDESEAAEAQANGWTLTAGDNPAANTAARMTSRRAMLKMLPAAGAIGASLAVPGGVIPAAIAAASGGAGGELARGLIERKSGFPEAPQTAGEMAGRAGKAAKEQGIAGLVGGTAAKAVGAVAKPIMRFAIRPTQEVARDFPGVVGDAIKYRVGVGGKSGSVRAKSLREESAEDLGRVLEDAKARGVRFNTADLVDGVKKLMRSKALPEKERERLMDQMVELINDKPTKVDPVLLKEIKQYYQAKASRIYKGKYVPDEAQESRGQFSREVAGEARKKLETIPGVREREKRTQSLIGLQRAIEMAERRNPLIPNVGSPTTYPFLSNPQLSSQAALFLSDPYLLQLLRQAPKAVPPLMEEPNR